MKWNVMKTRLNPAVVVPVAVFVFSNLHAQNSGPVAAQPSREEVESYVKEMTRYISSREERATKIVNQIVELDDSLKTAVSGVLTKLKSITDSQDSKTKVTRIKRDVIERIGKAAEYYAAERAKLEEALRVTRNDYKREDLFKERKQFDEKIDNMVNAVVDLALSMDTHKDYEKYIYENGSSFSGFDTIIRKNPDYEQNRRSTTQADAARKDVTQSIQQSLDRLKTRQRDLEQQIASPKLDEKQTKNLEAELDWIRTIRNERLEQLYALTSGEHKFTTPVSQRDAMQLEDVIELVAADARRDMSNLFARYRELRAERDAIADQKARLARAQNWLKEHSEGK